MAPPLNNNAEGGTNGVAVTTGNSGGASGNAWDTVRGAGTIFDNAHPADGTLAYKFTAAASPVLTTLDWEATALGSTLTFAWSRHYVYVPALPGVTTYAAIVTFDLAGTGVSAGITINDTGTIGVVTATGTVATTATITAGSLFRVESHLVCDPVVGTFEVKLFNSPYSTSPTETVSRTGQNTRAGFNALRSGFDGATLVSGYLMWLDAINLNQTGYPGPVTVTTGKQGVFTEDQTRNIRLENGLFVGLER